MSVGAVAPTAVASHLGSELQRLRTALARDAPPDEQLVQAVVAVLAAWAKGADAWPARPVAVVAVGSRTRPDLVGGLAARIGGIGRLPVLGSLRQRGTPGRAEGNSARRVRDLDGRLELPADLVATVAPNGEPLYAVATSQGLLNTTVNFNLFRRGF